MKLETAKWYVKHRNYLNKGWGEFATIKNIFEFYLVISVWLSLNHITMSMMQIVLATIVILVCFWFIGYWWDHRRFFNVENEFSNERNDFVGEVRKKLKVKK